MTQEELDILLVDWQRRLRLQDWKIIVRRVPQYEIPGKDGECFHSDMRKTATIRIANYHTSDTVVDHDFRDDDEFVIVHELLHLILSPLDDGERCKHMDQAEEVAINMIAGALVEAKRGNRHSVESAMKDGMLVNA